MRPCSLTLERRRERPQELVPLRDVQEPLDVVSKDSGHHDRKAFGGAAGDLEHDADQEGPSAGSKSFAASLEGAAEGEGSDDRADSRRPSAAACRGQSHERRLAGAAGHVVGQLLAVRARGGEADLAGGEPRRLGPYDPELCEGHGLGVPPLEELRGGDPTPVAHLLEQAKPQRLGESSQQLEGGGGGAEQLPGHADCAKKPGVQEPDGGGGGGEPEVRDPLDGRTTLQGRVLKRASQKALDRCVQGSHPFSQDFVVVQRGGHLLRRDRYDLANEPMVPDKVYIVLKEPDLFISAEFAEDYAMRDSEAAS